MLSSKLRLFRRGLNKSINMILLPIGRYTTQLCNIWTEKQTFITRKFLSRKLRP